MFNFKIFSFISRKRKIGLAKITILMFLSTITEMFTIGSLIPFLAILFTPDLMTNSTFLSLINDFILSNFGKENVRLFLTFTFIFFVSLSTVIKLFQVYLQNLESASLSLEIMNKVYKNYVNLPYEKISNYDTSIIISNVTKAELLSSVYFNPLLVLFSSSFTLMIFLSFFLFLYSIQTIILLLLIVSIYYLISVKTKAKLFKISKIISNGRVDVVKLLQNTFSGIRELILSNSQNYFVDYFQNKNKPILKSTAYANSLGLFPRYVIESILITGIALIGFYLSLKFDSKSLLSILPIFGAIILSAQRIMPLLQQVFSNLVTLKTYSETYNDVVEVLTEINPEIKNIQNSNIEFNEELTLNNISFKYDGSDNFILKNILITIKKGDIVGITGASGAGKSTLLDIIMGMLKPFEGDLCVDGKKIRSNSEIIAWQKHVAHVPQSVFIINESVIENINFGNENSVDLNRVYEVLNSINLLEHFTNTSFELPLGENGSKLSGGQIQRLGIGRAIYTNKKLLILDEFTSNLDNYNEKLIIDELLKLKNEYTIIMVTHNKNLLKFCNSSYELNKLGLIKMD